MVRTLTALSAIALASVVVADTVINQPTEIYSCVVAAFPYTCEDATSCTVTFADYTSKSTLEIIQQVTPGSGSLSWRVNAAPGTVVVGSIAEDSTGATPTTGQITVGTQAGASDCTLSSTIVSTFGAAAATSAASGASSATGAGATTAASGASSASSAASSAAGSASSKASSAASEVSSKASSAASGASSAASSAASSISSGASSATSAASSAAAAATDAPSSANLVQGSFLAATVAFGLALFA